MDVSEPKAGRGKRADYVRFTPVATRWMDNDVYGHLNNVVYYSLFDTAVNATLIGEGLLDPATGSMIALVVETGVPLSCFGRVSAAGRSGAARCQARHIEHPL